jgi:hypothetical protein
LKTKCDYFFTLIPDPVFRQKISRIKSFLENTFYLMISMIYSVRGDAAIPPACHFSSSESPSDKEGKKNAMTFPLTLPMLMGKLVIL